MILHTLLKYRYTKEEKRGLCLRLVAIVEPFYQQHRSIPDPWTSSPSSKKRRFLYPLARPPRIVPIARQGPSEPPRSFPSWRRDLFEHLNKDTLSIMEELDPSISINYIVVSLVLQRGPGTCWRFLWLLVRRQIQLLFRPLSDDALHLITLDRARLEYLNLIRKLDPQEFQTALASFKENY